MRIRTAETSGPALMPGSDYIGVTGVNSALDGGIARFETVVSPAR